VIDVDVLVVGSGFSGSLTAIGLRRQGHRVALLERGRHPRFAIGESSTPLANLLLEEFADRYDVPSIRAFSKWGTWQRTHPGVACGLKRGFTFLFHTPGEPFGDTPSHARQLMVAASPHDEIADTHWYRADFDHALVREAERAGVTYLDDTRVDSLTWPGGRGVVDAVRHGRAVRVNAGFVIDASGPRGFLHRALAIEEAPLRWLPRTEALYSHFEDVDLWNRTTSDDEPPFPPDAAAVHHVFPGGWIWVLRFNNGITSAGAALTAPTAGRLGVAEGAPAWARLLAMLPSIRDQFAHARATRPFVHTPQVAFRSTRVTGPGWALLPSAAGVIDPLLSTGFPLTLLGVLRILEVFGTTSPGEARDAALRRYEIATLDELEITERLVAALYATMHDPEVFKRLALLYFAAASFSEAARRLHRPALAPGFLLNEHPTFAPELRRCAELASVSPSGANREALLDRIDRAVEPFDIAGLRNRSRRDWYPVLPADLIANAPKLEATDRDIYALLERCGFASHHSSNASAGGPTRNNA
jgi:FADH2 O2-dependent halogenase